MAGPQGGTRTTIDTTVVNRAANILRTVFDPSSWFGPSKPLDVMVPEVQQELVQGRQFDFPVAYNRVITPRNTEAISFTQLRAFADNCDILRIVIETRKDQMAKLKWSFKPVNPGLDAADDPQCQELNQFFRFPDKENDWDTWLRMLIEEVLVTDAPSIYIRKTLGDAIYAVEPLDGATIKRVIDDQGRTPMPPEPAYMQVLKGINACEYTTEELLYRPRNKRVWKIYGYSPVEQIIMTINTAIRRSVHVLQSYTEGNVPEALVGVPPDWNPSHIKQFQEYFDLLLAGDTGERRKMKFIPGGMDINFTKANILKDSFDEWIARIVCFAFSVEPTAFVAQQNRATAETARDAALSEGLAPIMQWVENTMNFIAQQRFGYQGVRFCWDDEKTQDPLEKAQINQIYLNTGVLLDDEVRADLGRDPLTPEQRERVKAARTPPPMAIQPAEESISGSTGMPEEAPKEAIAKSKKSQPGPINPDRASMVKAEARLSATINSFFKSEKKKILARLSKIGKDDKPDGDRIKELQLTVSVDWDELVSDVQPILESIAKNGATAALDAVSVETETYGPRVSEWAADRAAELVGKKWVDGELIDNPNAEWVISDSTREMINGYTKQVVEEGLTMDEFSDMLRDSFAFSESRADMIARTETRLADSNGQMEGYRASGVVQGVEWTTSMDDLVSEECNANAAAGVVMLGDSFPSGDEAPPAHPNCRCVIIASLIPEDQGDNDDKG